MTDSVRPAGGGPRPADPMESVDRKLNVYALANGMDLERRGPARVLGWYREGMERGILLEPGAGEGTWAVRASAALGAAGRGSDAAIVRTLESALEPGQVLSRFTELLAAATEAANALRAQDAPGR